MDYRRATIEELDELVRTRIEVLRAANKLDESVDMSEVERQSRDYDKFVGAGAVTYFRVMPTYHNPSGEKAYIMNMYTAPEYRRKGIAFKTLDLLVRDAKERNVKAISLEATDMGRPLYEKYGFIKMNDEMELI